MQARTESRTDILDHYLSCRAFTVSLCESLEVEDFVIQSMTDASPLKWHLAHTTWFFETFVLRPFQKDYSVFDERLPYLFNSYYIQAGDRFTRADRGLLSRPTVKEVFAYRSHVDAHIRQFLEQTTASPGASEAEIIRVLTIGINHEQQHQELILTDLKHLLSRNPLYPSFTDEPLPKSGQPSGIAWTNIDEGIHEIGTSDATFFFDNEGPRHRYFIEPFQLASRTVTNSEFLEFVEEGGYMNPLLWLSEGWATVEKQGWSRPLYWSQDSGGWYEFSLHGLNELDRNAPACHISYFEADAYARWSGARLPSEFEWEAVAAAVDIKGNFAESNVFHPFDQSDDPGTAPRHLFGNLWEWTRSQYSPYPGYAPPPGALGEYNGKFMSNQFVLRGGSCATPQSHIRSTYRNFFPASARWQFSGIRLARDV